MKRILFICDYGQARSPAAAAIARQLGLQRGEQWDCRFFGWKTVDPHLGASLLQDAELVVTMEPRIRNAVLEKFPTADAAKFVSFELPMNEIGDRESLQKQLQLLIEDLFA